MLGRSGKAFLFLFCFSHRPARRFQHQPRFHQQILWLLLQKTPRICSLLSLHRHHAGPGCHPLSPGSWHQSTLNFHPLVYTPHGSALTSHHLPARAGLQSTGLPSCSSDLPSASCLEAFVLALPGILSPKISPWRFPRLQQISAPMSLHRKAFPDLPISNSSPQPYLLSLLFSSI